MREQFEVEYRGKPYLVERGDSETMSAGSGPGTNGGRYTVTLAGTAITQLDASPGDDEAAVAARVRAWLDAHPEMHTRDAIHLGGG